MVDPEASYQLCFAMRDYESFRLNYMVENLGISDPVTIRTGVSDIQVFADILNKNEEALDESTLRQKDSDLARELVSSHFTKLTPWK